MSGGDIYWFYFLQTQSSRVCSEEVSLCEFIRRAIVMRKATKSPGGYCVSGGWGVYNC